VLLPSHITFTVNGQRLSLGAAQVERAMKGIEPEAIQSHAVIVGGVWYPVKQVFARATGLDRLDFTSAVARRHLGRLGFELARSDSR
jgi:hypothetical protein